MGGAISVETGRPEPSATGDLEQRLLVYLRACLKAAAVDWLRVARNSRNRVSLTGGEAPVVGGLGRNRSRR